MGCSPCSAAQSCIAWSNATKSAPLDTLVLPVDAELKAEKDANLFGGVVVLKGFGQVAPEQAWQRKLYQPVAGTKRVPVKAIPYYAWDNRAPGAMKVWLPTSPPAPVAGGLETRARVTMSFANDNSQPRGINDGMVAKQSSDQPAANCHWWPHKGSDEWVQYTWTEPVTVSGARAFWFDDTGRGECRLPAAWRIEFLDGGEWRGVVAKGEYPIAGDKWCEVVFAPVKTAALRLALNLQPGWSAGVHEWQVTEVDMD